MSQAPEKPAAGKFTGLIGEPTGESLSRSRVDNLGFTTEHPRRPEGQSRQEYLTAEPGRMTGRFMREAGLTHRRRRGLARALVGLALLAGLLLGLWRLAGP